MKENLLKNITSVWIPMVFVVMTFYMDDAYFNLLGSKAYIFLLMVLLYTIGILLFEREKTIDVEMVTDKTRKFNFLDVAVLCFALIAVISNLFSAYKMDAFMGSYGWNVGTLYILALGAVYYMVSRYMKWKNWMYWVIFASACVVFVWAITDECYMDIFGMHEGIVEETAYNYLASIGNNNWFSGYWAMITPFLLFGLRKGPLWRNVLIGIGLFLSIFTGVNARPDSLFLGFGMIYALSLLRAIGDREKSFYTGIGWMITGLSIGVAKIVRNHVHMIEIDEIALKFMNSSIWLILLVVGILLLFMPNLKKKNWIRLAVFLLGIGAMMPLVLSFTKDFGPTWGTFRGYTWTVAVQSFFQGTFVEKIFGVGPDCFGYVYLAFSGSDWMRNAHNEYLQYLVTMGATGLLAYIGCYVGAFIELLRKTSKKDGGFANTKAIGEKEKTQELPVQFICFTGIMAYAAQAIVNNPQALNGAIFFTLLAILRGVDYTKRDEVI